MNFNFLTNVLTKQAHNDGRDYITPEDVLGEMASQRPEVVQIDLLKVIAKQTTFGCEDPSLCCFNALTEDDRRP